MILAIFLIVTAVLAAAAAGAVWLAHNPFGPMGRGGPL
jgi:hypothetical protein